MHEIGHALGVIHTQMRPDRDDYIKVKTSNIKKDTENNFRKILKSIGITHGNPYDFSSIFHYPAYVSIFYCCTDSWWYFKDKIVFVILSRVLKE